VGAHKNAQDFLIVAIDALSFVMLSIIRESSVHFLARKH
jgi:hypothetical protein